MGTLKGCLAIVGVLAILVIGSCSFMGYGAFKAVETAVEDGTFDEMIEEVEQERIKRENDAINRMSDYGSDDFGGGDWGSDTDY